MSGSFGFLCVFKNDRSSAFRCGYVTHTKGEASIVFDNC